MDNGLLTQAVADLEAGNFTRLESLLLENKISIVELLDTAGRPQEYVDEAFTWACMLGRTADAEAVLNLGANPEAGMKTGLAGAHYAASGGWLDTIRMIIRRKVPLETVNIYGGTVFGQAMWSAVNEHTPDHAAIVEALIEAGATVEPGYSQWWEEQDVPSKETKQRIAAALRSRTGD